MATTQKPKITRRGFRNAPENIRAEANLHVDDFASEECEARCHAELRPSAYNGPGSPGDLGCWTLILTGDYPWSEYRMMFIHPTKEN